MGSKIGHFLDNYLEQILGAVCLSFMVIFTFLNIFLRLAFKTTLPWLQEMTRYLFVWMVFISIGAAVKHRNHIRITFLQELVKGKAHKILEICVYIISAVFGAALLFYSIPMVRSFGGMTASSMAWFKMSYLYLCEPLGFISFVFRNLQAAFEEIKGLKTGTGAADTAQKGEGR